jgi:tetratricopeptide (TPR) repeat protein
VALAIDPAYVKAHYNLGQLLRKESRWPEAAAQYAAALRCSPNDVPSHLNLAGVLQELAQIRQAMDHFEAALRLDPDSIEALNNLAWLLATRPEPDLRDGPRAVELARRACVISSFSQAVMIGTLAAAYAEAGKFADAIATAERASALATQTGFPEVAAKNAELLQLYRNGKPYREPRGDQRQ